MIKFRRSLGERLLLHTVYDQIQEEPEKKAIVAYSIWSKFRRSPRRRLCVRSHPSSRWGVREHLQCSWAPWSCTSTRLHLCWVPCPRLSVWEDAYGAVEHWCVHVWRRKGRGTVIIISQLQLWCTKTKGLLHTRCTAPKNGHNLHTIYTNKIYSGVHFRE